MNINEIEVIEPIEVKKYKIFNDKLVNYILNIVENNTCISFDEMKDKGRKRKNAYPRFIAQYLIDKHTKNSLQSIAYLFGRKTHASTINGITKIKNFLEFDREIINLVDQIEDDLSKYLNKGKKTKYNVFKELLENIEDEKQKKEWISKYNNAI